MNRFRLFSGFLLLFANGINDSGKQMSRRVVMGYATNIT
jgi:hypothetical protein